MFILTQLLVYFIFFVVIAMPTMLSITAGNKRTMALKEYIKTCEEEIIFKLRWDGGVNE